MCGKPEINWIKDAILFKEQNKRKDKNRLQKKKRDNLHPSVSNVSIQRNFWSKKKNSVLYSEKFCSDMYDEYILTRLVTSLT